MDGRIMSPVRSHNNFISSRGVSQDSVTPASPSSLTREPCRGVQGGKAMNDKVAPVLTLAACLAIAAPVHADVVTEWNEIADGMTVLAPPFKNRIMAMVQVAVHDALNSIDARYEGYLGLPSANGGASPGAAVAAAAYRVLLGVVPSQAAALGLIYNG